MSFEVNLAGNKNAIRRDHLRSLLFSQTATDVQKFEENLEKEMKNMSSKRLDIKLHT